MVKVYGTIWAIVAVVAAAFLLAGSMTLFVGLALGFAAFGLIFAGMMMVLPATVAHRNHPDLPKVKIENEIRYIPTGTLHAR